MPGNGHYRERVLLVESDPGLRALLAAELSSWGLSVLQTSSLEDALHAVFTGGPFAAVVCDSRLPDGTGLFFKDWLREQIIPLPFVLLADNPELPPMKPSAHFAFIEKPFAVDRLHGALSRLIPDVVPARDAALVTYLNG